MLSNSNSASQRKRAVKPKTKPAAVEYEETKEEILEEVKVPAQGKLSIIDLIIFVAAAAETRDAPATLCANCQPTTKPKKVLSAYFFYSNETMPQLREEAKGSMGVPEAAKRVGVLWGGMTDDQKQKWKEMHEADVER